MKKIIFILCFLFIFGNLAVAQDEGDFELIDEMLFGEEEITTASKKAESIFDAPLSVSVITKEEIQTSGVTSIPEALRLIPGVIVREQTAGNYDVHLRGLDNIPPDSYFHLASNAITLVMIDNRIVYDYQIGGTLWEMLPIGLHDIERIEVVRGPSSALYGPNAVAGVINIITRKPEENGFYGTGTAQAGNYNYLLGNAAVGYKTDKFYAILSANKQLKDRHETDYYEWVRGIYVDDVDTLKTALRFGDPFPNPDERYPDPELGVDKFGINTFMNYSPHDEITLDLSLGYQESKAQKIYIENLGTPLTNNEIDTKYLNFKSEAFGFMAHFAMLDGYQNIGRGVESWQYDVNTMDIDLEYEYNRNGLTLRPGFSYRKATYDDSEYFEPDVIYSSGILNGDKELTTTAFSLRSEYNTKNLRVIGAVRQDTYNHPDESYLSYQLATTLKLKENQRLVRAVYSRANKGPVFVDTYNELTVLMKRDFGDGHPFYRKFIPNNNLDLLTMDMVEIGFRSKVIKDMYADVEAFYSQTENYVDTIEEIEFSTEDSVYYQYGHYENLPTTATQMGITGSVTYGGLAQNLKIKAFGTLQRTQIDDHMPSRTEAEKDSLIDLDEHKATPTFFGGFYINYQPTSRVNINLNPYFYTDQTFSHREGGEQEIEAKIIVNSKISYRFWEQCSVFFNARNLLNDDKKEYAFVDDIKGVYLLGANAKF